MQNWFVKILCMQSLEEGELCSTQGVRKSQLYKLNNNLKKSNQVATMPKPLDAENCHFLAKKKKKKKVCKLLFKTNVKMLFSFLYYFFSVKYSL